MHSEQPPRPLLLTSGYFTAFIALGLGGTVFGPTLPAISASLGVGVSDLAFIFTLSAAAYFVGGLAGGMLIDKLPINRVMAAVTIFISAGLFLVPAWGSLWGLALSFLVINLGMGVVDTSGNAGVVWTMGDRSTPYMNALHLFYGIGAFLAPFLISWLILKPGGWALSYRLIALIILPLYLPLFLLKSPPSPHEQSTEKKNGSDILIVALAAVMLFLYVGLEVGYTGWVSSYTVLMELGDQALGALMASIYWGAIALGRLLIIPISLKARPMHILIGSLLGVFVFTLGFLLFPTSLTALWIGTIGGGIAAGSVYPTVMSYVGRVMPLTGKIASYMAASGSLGAMTIPWVIGALFEAIDPTALQMVVGGSAALALLVYLGMVFYVRQKETVAHG